MKPRPSLPTSSSDFALPPSTSSALSNSSSLLSENDDCNPIFLRLRRPSLLAPSKVLSESQIKSPLANSYFVPRRNSSNFSIDGGEESESDRDKMWTDSPPCSDSGGSTPLSTDAPPTERSSSNDSDTTMKSDTSIKTTRPSTPTRQTPRSSQEDVLNTTTPLSSKHFRRLSQPIKMPRILTLLAESRPEENELKSEAQFQRMVAACSDLPLTPRTPRAASDRGRYPEEANTDEPAREETPSDDEEDPKDTTAPFAFTTAITSEPISFTKPVTPAQSVNGDDWAESPGGFAMDVDMPSSFGSPNMNSWRYTPPPTTSAVRSNKRKFDDRYDPYPTSTKRRAVSPSLSFLRESQPSLFGPRTPNGSSRVPMPLPITIPNGLNSGASSPIIPTSSTSTMTSSRPYSWGSAGVMSSPTLRAQMGLSSPILRPMMRVRKGEREEVEGAGEGVGCLSLEGPT